MGLDPGIDHMSAVQLLDEIKAEGGKITSFKSHCGGLVAPESDNNPWHYKISWNPRNVVLAGKAGAIYKQAGKTVEEKYEDLFDKSRQVLVGDNQVFSYYPNRNSMPYIDLYELKDATTFVRTTLRYPDFMYGWKNIIDLKLTDETPQYETDGVTLQAFFKEHLNKHGFNEWLDHKLSERFAETRALLDNLSKLMENEALARTIR
ncbi:MAG: saccharopine dehydrogenase C-terminal domain-containing protein [Ferruginibacter sp.]